MIPVLLFILALASVSRVRSQEISEIHGNGVVLLCSGADGQEVTWVKDKKEEKTEKLSVDAQGGVVKGHFSCKYQNTDGKEVKHWFYLDMKVCENCFELNGVNAMLVIMGDLLLTGGVILIVYLCVPKQSPSAQQRASNTRSSNPPRPPNPDYERLDLTTRSSDLYAGIK